MSKPKVLFIDDEERIVRSLAMQFRATHTVKSCIDPDEALEALRHEHYHVVVSDQRMPKMQGVELLRRAKIISPNSIGILLTGYADIAAITGAINDGEIFRYLTKPWDQQELKQTLAKATDIALQMEHISTTVEVNVKSHNVLIIDDSSEVYETITNILQGKYQVYWATNLEQVYDLLGNHEIALVIADLRLNGEDITSVLKTLKQYNPRTITIVLTSTSDSNLLIGLINQAQIFRYLPKPIKTNLLDRNIQAAMDYYNKLQDTPQLIKRHNVEVAPQPQQVALSGTISSFLSRFRGRLATSSRAVGT